MAMMGLLDGSFTLLLCNVVMGATRSHHAVCAPVSERYVRGFVFLSLSLCVGLFLSPAHTRQSGAAKSSSPTSSLSLHLTSHHVLLQLHSIQSLFMSFHFSVFCCFTSAQCCRPCRLVECGLTTHCPCPAENWTCFIETNPHVHCVHTIVHVQLDHCPISNVSNVRIPIIPHTDVSFSDDLLQWNEGFDNIRASECYAPLNSLVRLEWTVLLTQVFDLLSVWCHKPLRWRFALKLDAWKNRLKHHVTRGSRVHGDFDFQPLVSHLHDLLRAQTVTVLHTQQWCLIGFLRSLLVSSDDRLLSLLIFTSFSRHHACRSSSFLVDSSTFSLSSSSIAYKFPLPPFLVRCAVVNCLGVVHMEEEVQDRVQVEVGREGQGVGETHGKQQGDEKRENKRSINRTTWMNMSMGWCAQTHSWAMMWVFIIQCAHCAREKWRARCSCLHTQWETKLTVTKKKNWPLTFFMSSTNFWTCPTRNHLRKSAISGIVVEILVLQFLHPIHDGEGFLSETAARKSDRSRIGAFLPDLFNVRFAAALGIFWMPLWLDGACDLAVPTRPSLSTVARSSQFWVVNDDRLTLLENDREYLCNVHLERQLFCGISSTVLPCRAPWRRPFLIT